MTTLHRRIRFTTPAFLGNAEQSGQWRTPPFKALLRQWWRVARAARDGFPRDAAAMRRHEGKLFGNAWLDGDFRKSAVRLRLSMWSGGRATGEERWFDHDDRAPRGSRRPDHPGTTGRREADGSAAIRHPEMRNLIDPLLYLGYGPLVVRKASGQPRRGSVTVLKNNAAIQADETAVLSIAAPESEIDDLRAALALMNAYGTVGGRSRNGWGSLAVEPPDETPGPDAARAAAPADERDAVRRCVRPWRDALALDWPHAIGADAVGPLVWRTKESYTDWKALMRDLAILKIGLRTTFVFPNDRPLHASPQDRHWLSYPITRHNFTAWNNLRLPNSLRFKARRDRGDPKRLRGVIFHVPCRPPADFRKGDRAIESIKRVWKTTHALLDELTLPNQQQRRYTMIDDNVRRDELKPSLDELTLERSPE